MINQGLKLAIAGSLGMASVGVSVISPTLTTLTPNDLARFSNGEQIQVTAYHPNRLFGGSVGLIGLGVFSWWLWQELKSDDGTAPVEMGSDDAAILPRQSIQAPAGVPAPEKYIDVSAIVAQRLRPTLITGNPRIGKGIVVAHGIRHLKRTRDCPVWLMQPKYHVKECAYWETCDRVMGFMLEDYLGGQEDTESLCQEMGQFIHDWRKQAERPTLLVIDELSLIKAILPKWYKDFLIPQLITEMSSGETDERALWGITQSPLADDIGMSGGNRAPFDLLAIENPDSKEHLHSLTRSYRGVPLPEDDLVYRQSLSPKQAIFYHSAYDEWLPMLPYKRFDPAEAAEVGGSSLGSRGSPALAGNSAIAAVTTSVTSQLPQDLDLGTVLAVNRALVDGLTVTVTASTTEAGKWVKIATSLSPWRVGLWSCTTSRLTTNEHPDSSVICTVCSNTSPVWEVPTHGNGVKGCQGSC